MTPQTDEVIILVVCSKLVSQKQLFFKTMASKIKTTMFPIFEIYSQLSF